MNQQDFLIKQRGKYLQSLYCDYKFYFLQLINLYYSKKIEGQLEERQNYKQLLIQKDGKSIGKLDQCYVNI
ncbi:unnamed protein product [Paramecium sonneborni]|uniref:Uncharacterized protein n=1 Tax=Paramecium sonneborni TaxID=65129 RepID=A0A8S1RBT8_9CILI|nr:unnamed protein product [Paramecium sonneborni]